MISLEPLGKVIPSALDTERSCTSCWPTCSRTASARGSTCFNSRVLSMWPCHHCFPVCFAGKSAPDNVCERTHALQSDGLWSPNSGGTELLKWSTCSQRKLAEYIISEKTLKRTGMISLGEGRLCNGASGL